MAWASSVPLHASAQPAALTQYRVSYAGNDQFRVEASFAQPTTRLDLNSHQSKARPKGQAESIRGLRAFDAAGNIYVTTFGFPASGPTTTSGQLIVFDHSGSSFRNRIYDQSGHGAENCTGPVAPHFNSQ